MDHEDCSSEGDEVNFNTAKTKSVRRLKSCLTNDNNHGRVIVCIDIDCFYAQVEIIRNPQLRGKCIGIQQKNYIVTCNYEARALGLSKLILIDEAKRLVPSLIIINGENLKPYREMSEKINAILLDYSSRVEKQGLDENFVDLSDRVTSELNSLGDSFDEELVGNIYSNSSSSALEENCICGCKKRLVMGSIIAQEIRTSLFENLGITSTAGIAHNKFLAKLVGSLHKPNQQSTIFPAQANHFILSYSSLKVIPGIGYSTYSKLSDLGLTTIEDLRHCDIQILIQHFGEKHAIRMKHLCLGIDDSEVKYPERVKTIGAEDGFLPVTTPQEIERKLLILLRRVYELLYKDGRLPSTIKLIIRKLYYQPHKYSIRDARQCPISSTNIFGKRLPQALEPSQEQKIVSILMKTLLPKMLEAEVVPWRINLVGVSFSNFQSSDLASPAKSINSFFLTPVGPESNMKNVLNQQQQQQQPESVSVNSFQPVSSTLGNNKRKIGNLSVEKVTSHSLSTKIENICYNLNDHNDDEVGDGDSKSHSSSFLEDFSDESKRSHHPTAAILTLDIVGRRGLDANSAEEKMNKNLQPLSAVCSNVGEKSREESGFECPNGLDAEVFYALPKEIQAEISRNNAQIKFNNVEKRPRKTNIMDFFSSRSCNDERG